MALKLAGDLSWKLQVGARGPTPDTTYGLYRREEEWQGKQDDLAAFLASKPVGAAYPTAAWLTLSEYEPTYLEAGMARCRLTYTGHPSGGSQPTKRLQRMLKTESKSIMLVRRFERVTSSSTINGITTKLWGPVEQEAPGQLIYSYYTPSITYRYTRQGLVKAAQYTALAATDLAGLAPVMLSVQQRQTDPTWVTRSGVATNTDLSLYEIRNFSQTYEFEGGETAGTPTPRAAELSCELVGEWGEVEETHEIELT